MTPKATWLSHYTFTVELSEFETISTGGFTATWFPEGMKLEFVVGEWHSY